MAIGIVILLVRVLVGEPLELLDVRPQAFQLIFDIVGLLFIAFIVFDLPK